MKGLVVDKKGRHAVVLTGDGSFIKISNSTACKVGCEIEFTKHSQSGAGLYKKIASIAAVFLFTLGLSYGAYSYAMPYSYVDLDINPSIEMTANVFDIIIKAETLNEDGKKIMEKHDMKFKTLSKGVSELVNSAIEQGYLQPEAENAVLLTVTSRDSEKTEKLEKKLETSTEKSLNKSKIKSSVVSQQSSTQMRDTARDLGISPGKFSLIEKAIEADPALKMEKLKDAPVNDIMKYIKENKGDKDGIAKEAGGKDESGDGGKGPASKPSEAHRNNYGGKSDKPFNKGGDNDTDGAKGGKPDKMEDSGKPDYHESPKHNNYNYDDHAGRENRKGYGKPGNNGYKDSSRGKGKH